jgi:uncharacterized protein with von Willebrand factor type A (vWA) domain
LDLEISISQKYIDNMINTITNDFEDRKILALNNLEKSVESLCEGINEQLNIKNAFYN